MKKAPPDFLSFSAIEEQILSGKLKAIQKVLTHSGEKGRSLEAEAMSLLRTFLPNEYGLSTGFVVFQGPNGPQLSSQLDIIVYDAIRSGPIARLTTCDVFPLEAVYGYIEVKASLRSCSTRTKEWPSDSIEKCIDINQGLRTMLDRRFWKITGTTSAGRVRWKDPPAVRSYILAFSAKGTIARDPKRFAQRMANYLAQVQDAHLHGVFIAGRALYITRPTNKKLPTSEAHHVKYTIDHPLAAFKWILLHDLGRYPRMPVNCVAAIDRYRPETNFEICAPQQYKPAIEVAAPDELTAG